MTLSMKADSYDTAMLENLDDHITVVDGVPNNTVLTRGDSGHL